MNSYNINSKSVLKEVCIKSYRVNNDVPVTLVRFDSTTTKDLIKRLSSDSSISDIVSHELSYPSQKQIVLMYTFNGEEFTFSIHNSTIGGHDENFSIKTDSSLLIDSIIIGKDLVPDVNDEYIKDTKGCPSLEKYYDKYLSKGNIMKHIINILKDKNCLYSDSFGHKRNISDDGYEKEVKNKLLFIPKANLRNLALETNYIISEKLLRDVTFSGFIKEASKEGLLKFSPYLTVNMGNTPTLVLKHNRYVHLFRGYDYQCSYTSEGIGSYSNAGIRIDIIRHMFLKYDLGQSRLLKCLYYMNLIQCCKGIDEFNDLLKYHPEVVDEFMSRSTAHLFNDWNISYRDDIVNNIVSLDLCNFGEDSVLSTPKVTYRVPASDTSDYARINVYRTHIIGVEVWADETVKEVLFKLPKPYDSESELNDIADNWGESSQDMSKIVCDAIYNSYEVRCALTAFALNFCGFVTNFIVTYPVDFNEESKLRALNNLDIIEFKSLDSLPREYNANISKATSALLSSLDKMN